MKKQKLHVASPECTPLARLLSQLSGQWTLYILCVLDANGSLRFGELKSKVHGISTKVLTERLRMLEAAEIIHRHHKPTIPPQVSYSLTARGKDLSGILDQLCILASQWYGSEEDVRSAPD